MVSFNSILFSRQHITEPFTYTPPSGTKISIADKKAYLIGISILIGLFTFVIGGIIAFYSLTAHEKLKKFRVLESSLRQRIGFERIPPIIDRVPPRVDRVPPIIDNVPPRVDRVPPTKTLVENMCITGMNYSLDEMLRYNSPNFHSIVHILNTSQSEIGHLPQNKAAIYGRHLEVLKSQIPSSCLNRYEFNPVLDAKNLAASISTSALQEIHSQTYNSWIRYGTSNNDPSMNVTKVSFGNKFFGGGWCSGHLGFLQEEQLIAHHPTLALLAAGGAHPYHKRFDGDGGIICRKGEEEEGRGQGVPQLFRGNAMVAIELPTSHFQLADKSDIHQVKPGLDMIMKNIPVTQADYGILTLAAPRHQKNTPHNMDSLRDLFSTAYTGFRGLVLIDQAAGKNSAIETGSWGAGDFNNNLSVSIAVQYLAARLAGVRSISFYMGSNNAELANRVIHYVDQILKNCPGATAEQILLIIQQNQH